MANDAEKPAASGQLAANLKAMLPNPRATLQFAERTIPGLLALQIAGGPEAPRTEAEAEQRVDRLWSELRRIMDEELRDEIAGDKIVSGETTAEACVEAAKHIFRIEERGDTWAYSTLADKRSIITLRKEADGMLRPAERASASREHFRDNYEWPILLALARLLLRAEAQSHPANAPGHGGAGLPALSPIRQFLAVNAVIVLVAAGAYVIGFSDSRSAEKAFTRNPAGEIGRTIPMPPLDDLYVANGFAWVASSKREVAFRVDEAYESLEKFEVGLPAPQIELPPSSNESHHWDGYQITIGDYRAWVVSTTGSVVELDPDAPELESATTVARVRANAGPVELSLGSIWIGGLTGEIVRLHAETGRIEHRYRLPNSVGTTELTVGHCCVWALDYDQTRVYALEDWPGTLHTYEPSTKPEIISLDRPAQDIAAGYGGLWVVHRDGTVALYDIDTGKPEYAQMPAKGVAIAISVGSAWVATEDNTVIRISASDKKPAGEPIELPEPPIEIAAEHNPWVATKRALIEIIADPSEKPS